MKTDLIEIHDILFEKFGPQHWWPAETPFEVVVGAILTQSTAWKNVEKAIANLKKEGSLSPEGLRRIEEKKLSRLIRPAGYYNAKTRKLKEFIKHLYKNHGGDLEPMLNTPPAGLRRELLSIWGIGPETADSIILYAAEKPVFVVDAYTKRIFSRLCYVDGKIGYEGLKEFSEKNLPRDVKVYNEFHALLVRLGKDYCRKTKPLCNECPLEKRCKKTKTSKKK